MSPNLMLIATNACHPFCWKPSKSNNNGLYYSTLPVPGIYSENSRGARYLVALKPNSKKDVENIFRHSPANSRANSFNNIFAQATNKKTTMKISKPADINSGDDVDDEIDRNPGVPYANNRWSSSVSSLEYSASEYSCGSIPRPPPNSIATIGTETPFSGNSSTVTFSEPMKFPHEPTHQDRNRQPADKINLKFWKSSNDTKSHFSQIDVVGYMFLSKPLKIEYNNILSSWRFSEEIKARKMTITGCKDYDCQDKNDCKKDVKLEFMLLDDAQTGVLVNKIITRTIKRQALKRPTSSKKELIEEITGKQQPHILKSKKRGSKVGFDNEVLFWPDITKDATVLFKPLSDNDGVCARIRLDVYNGRFVCPENVREEKKNWMKVVRYCEGT